MTPVLSGAVVFVLMYGMKTRIAFFILLAAAGKACISVNDPERSPFAAPHSAQTLSALSLDRPAPEPLQEFRVLFTGSVRVPRSGMLDLDDPLMGNEADAEMYVDVFAFRFCRRQGPCYLIDTGLDASYQHDGNLRGMLAANYVRGSRQKPGQDIGSQLARFSRTIEGVLFTHLHGDHTAGAPALPEGLRYFAGESEQYINYYLLYYGGHLDGVTRMESIDARPRNGQSRLDSAVDIFGNGSLWAISTPGHSNGHLSYLLRTEQADFLLTGDASHTRLGFERGVPPGWLTSREAARQSIQELRAFADRWPRLTVIFGHELPPAFPVALISE